jgi:hypothetical protein
MDKGLYDGFLCIKSGKYVYHIFVTKKAYLKDMIWVACARLSAEPPGADLTRQPVTGMLRATGAPDRPARWDVNTSLI